MTREHFAAERQRFAKVVAARKTNRELLELFEKLGSSDKFSPEAKPYCYGDLIEASIRRVSDKQVMQLLEAVESSGAANLVRAVYDAAQADIILRGLVKKAFKGSPMDESCLMEAFARLELSGVSADRGHALALALEAGMTIDELDPICDLTFYAYYPSMRPKPAELALAA